MRLAAILALCLTLAEPAGAGSREGQISSILFVGNSLTYGNELPSIVCRLAAAGGHSVRCDSVARPNFSLGDHWEEGTAARRIRKMKPSIVVMQQGPSGSVEGRALLLTDGARWSERISKSGGRPAFFMVWPAGSRFSDFPRVTESYRMASLETNGILLPAGNAWLEAWRRDRTLKLYGPDGFHPSLAGSYLAALTIYRGLFGEIPPSFADVRVATDAAGGELGLTPAQLRTLIEAAGAAK